MRFAERVSAWATVEKFSRIAELLLKLSAIVVALLAANFFLLRPHITIEKKLTQRRLDFNVVNNRYASRKPTNNPIQGPRNVAPPILDRVFRRYEALENARAERLQSDEPVPQREVVEFCRATPQLVNAAGFRGASCSNGRFQRRAAVYDVWLLQENANAPAGERMPPAALARALEALDASSYSSELYRATNTGDAVADDLRIVPPNGYRTVGASYPSAPLSPGHSRVFAYRFENTVIRGDIESSWKARAADPNTLAVKITFVLFGLLALAVIVNDFRRGARAPSE